MWTSTALASEHRTYQGAVWRLVEGQHRISTNRLARDGATQALLEELAEEVKPMVPEGARHLHFLLATPFRYGHKSASRFRRANERPGIFYAAEAETTAIAETAYWSLRFFSRSPGFRPPPQRWNTPASMCASRPTVPWISRPRLRGAGRQLISPDDYTACQDLATQARGPNRLDPHLVRAREKDNAISWFLLPKPLRSPCPRSTGHGIFVTRAAAYQCSAPSLPRTGTNSLAPNSDYKRAIGHLGHGWRRGERTALGRALEKDHACLQTESARHFCQFSTSQAFVIGRAALSRTIGGQS
jgi:hypothetical protein